MYWKFTDLQPDNGYHWGPSSQCDPCGSPLIPILCVLYSSILNLLNIDVWIANKHSGIVFMIIANRVNLNLPILASRSVWKSHFGALPSKCPITIEKWLELCLFHGCTFPYSPVIPDLSPRLQIEVSTPSSQYRADHNYMNRVSRYMQSYVGILGLLQSHCTCLLLLQ